MDYPLWLLPAKGLLIAAVAVVHVFISHFAVGGGLFLVLAERKARREQDAALFAYVRLHSRFFILLTLVAGAITGVGIWFTIGLIHPTATASLINAFVWAWAIEWTFFVTEIAAAMVYYYGWDHLDARTHQAVGWIYFGAAWLSLVVINGILSFMLTPGAWLDTHRLADGLLNPTYWPSMFARTFAAIGLAGIYALLTASRLRDEYLKERVARYASGYVLPMAIALPLALAWFLGAAFTGGVPLGEPLGAPGAGIGGALTAVLTGSPSGHPVLVRAVQVVFAASLGTLLLAVVITRLRPRRYGLPLALGAMTCAFLSIGAGEWVREDLRKPYVIGQYMFVNGVRAEAREAHQRNGILAAAAWRRPAVLMAGAGPLEQEGEEVFRLLCSTCHTIDGYLAIRPLVRQKRQAGLETVLTHLDTWRGRRMPPFTGSESEKRALAAFLERLGGTPAPAAAHDAAGSPAARYFDDTCAACHGEGGEFPIGGRGRTAAQLYEMLGRLPAINDVMPPFEGDEALRRGLASHLAALPAAGAAAPKGGDR